VVLDRLAEILAGGGGPAKPRGRLPEPSDSFPEQWAWVTSDERENLVMVARQSGKSTGAALRACRRSLLRPGRRVLYTTLTIENCEQLFVDPCLELLDKLEQPHRRRGKQIIFPNDSRIYYRSVDTLSAARKARGPNWDDVLVDEIQDLEDRAAQVLIEDVLGPTLFRRKGSMSLMFTPPRQQKGWLWKEFTSGRWRLWNWAQAANPFLPPGEQDRWLAKHGLTWDHPVARRELLGLWEPDVSSQVFDLDPIRNGYDELPKDLPANGWRYGVGGDIGWEHDDALVVLAWNIYDPQKRIFEVFFWRQQHQDIDQLFAKFREVWQAHRPMLSVVLDQAGAGGQKVIATIENRFQRLGLPITIEYKPANVPASVGIVNDNARTGRLLLRRDSPLWADVPHVVWKEDSNRQEIDKSRFDSHGLDGLRYGVWGVDNYLARAPRPEMTEEEKRRHRRTVMARRGGGQRW
jgi:terminase large subunit-like protein